MLPLAAAAQITQAAPPPLYNNVDSLGIDLTTGYPHISTTEASIGPADGGVAFIRTWVAGAGWTDNWTGGAFSETVGGVTTYYVEHGPTTETFSHSGTTFTNLQGTGSTLTGGATGLTYTGADGTVTTYTNYNTDSTGYLVNLSSCSGDQGTCLLPSTIAEPNGVTYTLKWTTVERCPNGNPGLNCGGRTYYRLLSIKSSLGYQVAATYAISSFTGAAPPTGWFVKNGMQYTNTLVSCGTSCPSVTYPSGSLSDYNVIDAMGREWQFPGSAGGSLAHIIKPGSTSDAVTINYSGAHVSSVVIAGVGTWTYNFTDSGTTRTVVVTDPLGHTRTEVSDLNLGRPTSDTDGNGKITTRAYGTTGLLAKVTAPEGNYIQYTYDTRGNVTGQRVVSKTPGTPADIVTSAAYPTTCSSVVTCNLPTSTTDANGNETDYTYNATTGQVATVTAPAPTSTPGAARPTTTYGYTTVSGASLLNTVSTCATAATCAGTANETKTTIGYNTNGLPTSVIEAAGDGSVSAPFAYTYDATGNLTSIDGPLAGTADTTVMLYDADRERTEIVSPDPDGTGPRKNTAVSFTYSSHGVVTNTALGTANADGSGFAALQQVATTLDTADRPVMQVTGDGTTVYGVTQTLYDGAGRAQCQVTRMNPANWTTLMSGCTPDPTGPDRVTYYTYDNANQLTQTTSAYGTSAASNDVTTTYNPNGTQATLTDGNGNLTTYSYDGFDRLVKTAYPSPTTPGISSTTDYEQLGYDANGNVTSRRLRDATSIAYTYDHLNRLTLKDLPGSDPDVTLGYDLLNRLTGAATSAQALTFGYDALSRMTSQGGPLGTMSAQYDPAGHRTQLTWPDMFYVAYDYDNAGNMLDIRENGAASGIGVLATFAYDDLGNRTSLTRGNGTTTGYTLDAMSRLSTLAHDLSGTANDLSLGFSYAPASQIAGTTRSNDSYAWTGSANKNLAYGVNGLNQMTAVGAGALGYDARGNLTSTGANAYTYSSENLLLTGPGATATYDPLMRLYQTTGTATLLYGYDGTQRIAEYNSSGTLQRRYVFGPGDDEPLVWYEGTGTSDRRWLHTDERGSVVAVSNASGASIATNTYDEYGVPGSGNIGAFQYTGQTWLSDFGLYYYKARMYSSALGRFMQTDPIGYGDGPNWYNYVGNDPINALDPSGLEDIVSTAPVNCGLHRSDPRCSYQMHGAPQVGNGVHAPGGGTGGVRLPEVSPVSPPPVSNLSDKEKICRYLNGVSRVAAVIGFTNVFNAKGVANAVKLLAPKLAVDIVPGVGEAIGAFQLGATAAGAAAALGQYLLDCN